MATTPFSSQKSVSPRLAWRTLRDAHTKHLRTQIFVLLAFTKHASPKFSNRKIKKFAGGRRLAIPKRADELVEFDALRDTRRGAASGSAVARATREREVQQLVRTRSRRSARQSPKHSRGAGPRTTSRHTPTCDLSTLFQASFFNSLPANCSLSTSSALSHSNTALPVIGAPRWPEASAWASQAPAACSARTPASPRGRSRGAPYPREHSKPRTLSER